MVLNSVLKWTGSFIKISLNIILDSICLKWKCLLSVYDFIIVHNFEKKIEVVVWFGGEIYTSIVQYYVTPGGTEWCIIPKFIPVDTTI